MSSTAPIDDSTQALAQRIDAALPQTQCTRCGFADCARYARAIAMGEARINQCPPGGAEGIARLAAITGQSVAALNPQNGIEAPRRLTWIDEAACIGCTLCIQACPTDAIIGCAKHMHTVIEARCTGCELCVPVCPVDCIVMENASGERTGWQAWSQRQAEQARDAYRARTLRLARECVEDDERRLEGQRAQPAVADSRARSAESLRQEAAANDKKRAMIEAALARAREQRQRARIPAG